MKYRSGIRMRLAMVVAMAFAVAGCMKEDFSDCIYGVMLKVVVAEQNGNTMGEGTFDNVTLYVFGTDGVLLESRSTQLGHVEILDYPGETTLRISALANVGDNEEVSEFTPGRTTLTQARVLIRRSLEGTQLYRNPDDLFQGAIEVDYKAAIEAGGVIELPINRIVGGVYVHVHALREYLDQPDAPSSDFHIVLGGRYNYRDFLGIPAYDGTRDMTDPVQYKFTGTFGSVSGASRIDFPAQSGSAGKTEYVTVLASDTGMSVSVGLYYKGTLVTSEPITSDSNGQPLMVKDNVLNVIAIDFRGDISVNIKRSAWGSTVDIEKEF